MAEHAQAAKSLLASLTRKNAEGVEQRLAELIRSGELSAGYRLPPVRSVARHLAISTGAVAEAWKNLRNAGLIETRRRGGTVVVPQLSDRSHRVPPGAWLSVDLAQGVADPALQPSLRDALLFATRTRNLHDPHREQITEPLLEAIKQDWPFAAAAWTTHGGGTEGTLLALEAAAPRGSVIALENPTSPRIIDALQMLDLRAIAVGCDEDGPLPGALEAALAHRPVAFLYQTRAHLPLGHSVSAARLAELAEVVRRAPYRLNVIEDDNTGPIALSADVSMGDALPDRVLHIRSFCKAFGVDLHTSVVGGAGDLIARTQQLRSHGAEVTSRILQNAVAHMLGDAAAQARLDNARRLYASRRIALSNALAAHGLTVRNRDGIGVWLPVPDEASALVNLAAHGVTVSPGSRCLVAPAETQHLRIATSRLPDDPRLVEHLGELIARSVSGIRRPEFD